MSTLPSSIPPSLTNHCEMQYEDSVGIIGCGLVGEHLSLDLVRTGWNICIYDLQEEAIARVLTQVHSQNIRGVTSLTELTRQCHTVFIALPTPASDNGHDLSAINTTLDQLQTTKYTGLILIKSTVCPGTLDELSTTYRPLRLFHVPEFLSSQTADLDSRLPTQPFVLLGVPKHTPAALTDRARSLLEHASRGRQQVIAMHSGESEATKLFCNAFYAAKVQLFNEFYQIAQSQGINYESLRQMMLHQGWIHPMHTQVPGPDGQFGFGGACLPKDTLALTTWLKDTHICCPMLQTLGRQSAVRHSSEEDTNSNGSDDN